MNTTASILYRTPPKNGDKDTPNPTSAMTTEEEHSNLEKVTDFVDEKELDNERTKNALSSLVAPTQTATSQRDSNRAMQSVKYSDEDVKVIMSELEVDKEEAQAALLSAKGDVVMALRQLVH